MVRQRQRRWETHCGVLALDAVVRFRGELCRGKWNAELDVEDLRTFVEVADAGGVSPAALRLGVSKSIVSRRLVRLEGELGVQLLTRSTRGAALTEAGATFRDHAARVCAEIDAARETILPAGRWGDTRGGVIPGNCSTWAAMVFGRCAWIAETSSGVSTHTLFS